LRNFPCNGMSLALRSGRFDLLDQPFNNFVIGSSVRSAIVRASVLLVCLVGVLCISMLRVFDTADPNHLDADSRRFDESSAHMSAPVSDMSQIIAKSKIVETLASGDIGLPEAMSRVSKLYESEPPYLARLRADHPNATDDELIARNLIACVSHLPRRQVELAGRVAELEAELKRLGAADGARNP
jgi:hypothetical protein